MAESTSIPYLPPIGAIVTARRLEGHWRVIKHVSDELVRKCVLKSMGQSQEIVTRFAFEITELSDCSYEELNDFFLSVSGLSQEDLEFDDEFGDEGLLNLEQLAENDCPSNTKSDDTPEPTNKRFKHVKDQDIDHLMAQNSEKSTEKQTKWAVKLLKCNYQSVLFNRQ